MNTFLIIILAACLIGLALIIIYTLIIPKVLSNSFENNLKQYLDNNQISYNLEPSKNRLFNLELTINETIYLLKIINIPNNAEVQVNNMTTWEVKYGAGNHPGKAQPNHKYLSGIAGFMNYKPQTNEKRIVVMTPKSKKIVMYINECEIVFVTPTTNVYGVNIINMDDFQIFK